MIPMPKIWLCFARYFVLDEKHTRSWWLALVHSQWGYVRDTCKK